MVTFGSLFSGIGGFDLGFEQAGMECVWQCEIDKSAKSVLAKHWPGVPCIEDVRDVTRNNVAAVDLICGGFPCQDVSVAGKRAGLAGDRSGLWFEFHRVVEELRPKWVVVENVPGLLSSNGGADFAVILRGLVECGYGITWRVLDAQYFGVAQRRRRVFIVGSLGDGRSAQILFERKGLFGHPPARRTAGQSVTPSVGAQPPSRRNGGSDPTTGTMIAGTLAAGAHPGSYNGNDAQRGNLASFDWQTAGSERTSIVDEPGATRGLSSSKTLAIAYNIQQNDGAQQAQALRDLWRASEGLGLLRETLSTLQEVWRPAENKAQPTHAGSGVRRLTPTECCRLQGFPDDWNAYGIMPDGELVPQSDSARYRQLGNAVAVPVARWIGERIVAL